jgi:acyl-CoA synthetase (AMP-forming)/AMP-acid ligase II
MVQPLPRGRNPFDETGVQRGADGVARYLERPPSLVALLRASVERDAAAVALVEVGGDSIAYGELWRRAARVAGGLRGAGVARGDRVAIRLGNGIDWVLAFFGAQLLGAVVVPVNTRFTEEEVAYVVADSGASYTFEPGAALPDGEPPQGEEDLGPDDLAAIFYTSGTTGFPKGAMTSHANFTTNSENAFRCLATDRTEGPSISTLVSVPLFHVTGCNSQLIPMLELGGRIEILSGPIAESLVQRIKDAFPNARVGNGFGLTETSSLTSFLPHEEAEAHADPVGFAMPVVDLALDEADPQTGVGELLVRGPNVVQGYWNKPSETAVAFTDGWLHTGDLARVDADGLLYIVDRKKDMINRGGENVYSIEVENVLAGAPGVGEVAVVPVPDEMMGEKVGAVIVPAAGQQLDVEAVLRHSRTHLADFKVPQYVAVREQPLPRNPGGKILKARLREETSWGKPLR